WSLHASPQLSFDGYFANSLRRFSVCLPLPRRTGTGELRPPPAAQRPETVRPTASLDAADRYLWVVLSRVWQNWRAALAIVRPETVVAWHRQGFRLFWTWKVRRGKPGRPAVPREVRELIRQMSRDNPLWGAPHIHGELLKLGIAIGETHDPLPGAVR